MAHHELEGEDSYTGCKMKRKPQNLLLSILKDNILSSDSVSLDPKVMSDEHLELGKCSLCVAC